MRSARRSGANICYYQVSAGRWIRRAWKPQCRSKVFLSGRCQGVQGHKGVHWCYAPSGSFQWEDNAADPQHDGCAGSTPPGHKDYITPVKMQRHYFMDHYTDTEVTDQKVVALLANDKTPERGASINRPVIVTRNGKATRR